jgi:hypothetical protein
VGWFKARARLLINNPLIHLHQFSSGSEDTMKKGKQKSLEDFLLRSIPLNDVTIESKVASVAQNHSSYQDLISYLYSNNITSGIEDLCNLLDSNLQEMKDVSKKALICIGKSAIPTLFDQSLDANSSLRRSIGDIMVQFGLPSAKYILDNIENTSPEIKSFYVSVLGEIGDPITIPFIKNEIRVRNHIRGPFRDAILKIGEPISSALIELIFRRQKKSIQADLIDLVCEIGGKKVLKLIPLTFETEYKEYWPDIISCLQEIDDSVATKIVQNYYSIIESERSNEWGKRSKQLKKQVFR